MIQTVLAIETSTKTCSIALHYQTRFYELEEKTDNLHGKNILPMVHEVLRGANCDTKQINWIAFGQGPGSFTGLRIGIGVVQGLAFGWNCNTMPISSLLAVAETAFQKTKFPFILAGLDARMGEIYYGAFAFQDNHITTLALETVLKPDAIQIPEVSAEWLAVGSGFDQYFATLNLDTAVKPRYDEELSPRDPAPEMCNPGAGSRKRLYRSCLTGCLAYAEQLQKYKIQHIPHLYPSAAAVARLSLMTQNREKMISAEESIPVYLRGL